jgi:peptidoglycan/xylan/chitin deacetylase (PgdA/CDA1 family)
MRIPTAAVSVVGLFAGVVLAAEPAATTPPRVSVTPFRHDRLAAASFTFDDGHAAHVDELMPALEQRGFRATFYVVTGWTPDVRSDAAKGKASWADWRAAAARGHEIGNHSATHASLGGVTNEAALNREIAESAVLIAEKTGVRPRSFAYAFCKANPRAETVVRRHHVAGRKYHPIFEGQTPPLDQARRWIEAAISNRTWHVYLSHGMASGPFAEHLDWLKSVEDRVWVAPYGEVAAYRRERERATLGVQRAADGEVVFVLAWPADADPALYDVPLTVKIETAGAFAAPEARRGAAALPVRALDGALLVDAAPGPEPVRVTWRRP